MTVRPRAGPWRVLRERHDNGGVRRIVVDAKGWPVAYVNGDPGPPARIDATADLIARAPNLHKHVARLRLSAAVAAAQVRGGELDAALATLDDALERVPAPDDA